VIIVVLSLCEKMHAYVAGGGGITKKFYSLVQIRFKTLKTLK